MLAVLAAPMTWLLLFLIIPLVLVAIVGLATVQENYLLSFTNLTLEHYATVLDPTGEPFQLLGRSLGISLAATAMSLGVGYAVAYFIARLANVKWRGILMALVVVPFWVTFIVRIYGLILFIRPDGYVDLGFSALGLPGVGAYFVRNFGLGTDALLVFTLVYVWLPFMVLPLFTSLSKLDAQLLEAAYDLGATRLRAFWNVTLPLSLPGIITGSIFVFITTLGSFVEPDFLSASPMIGNYVNSLFGQTQGVGIPLGAAASVFIIVSTMLLVTIYARYSEMEESGVFTAQKRTRRAQMLRFAGMLLVTVALDMAATYVLAGAVRAGSAGGVLDALLLWALLPILAALTLSQLYRVFGNPLAAPARRWAADGLAALLLVLAAWILVHAVWFSFDTGRPGLSPLTAIGLAIVGAIVGVVVIALAVAGIVIHRNRDAVAAQPFDATLALLLAEGHALGSMAVGATRILDRIAERHGRRILAAVTAITMLIFFVPLIMMSLFSFTAGENPSAWEGFSFRWYVGSGGGVAERPALFTDESVLGSLGTSAIVGLASAFLSMFLGMMAAFAIDRYVFRGKSVLNHAMYLGLVIPSIVMGISLSVLIRLMNDSILDWVGARWDFGLVALIVGHTTFNIPLATLILLISFREFDRSLEEAAWNLGARPLTAFFRVTIPNIMPGIVSTLLLTFTFSFDEFPVSLFLAGSNPTYPIVAWGLLSKKIPTPEANAAATLILVISFVFVLLANKVQKGGAIFRI